MQVVKNSKVPLNKTLPFFRRISEHSNGKHVKHFWKSGSVQIRLQNHPSVLIVETAVHFFSKNHTTSTATCLKVVKTSFWSKFEVSRPSAAFFCEGETQERRG